MNILHFTTSLSKLNIVQSNDEHADDDEVIEGKLDASSEEISLAEDITNCSLNENDTDCGECNSMKENTVDGQQKDMETKNQNDDVGEEKGKIEVQEEKNEHGLVGDTANNNDEINQEQSLDNDDDQAIDCNDQDNIDDEDVCYQDDGNDDGDVDYHGNSDDDDSDDDDGWITPGNISQIKADYGISETQSRPTNIAVGCLTTDFAMQVIVDQIFSRDSANKFWVLQPQILGKTSSY